LSSLTVGLRRLDPRNRLSSTLRFSYREDRTQTQANFSRIPQAQFSKVLFTEAKKTICTEGKKMRTTSYRFKALIFGLLLFVAASLIFAFKP
jgi:hypothetical protein